MIIKEVRDKEAHKLFWKEKNKVCLKCQKKCKQSSKVVLIKCNDYIKLEEKSEGNNQDTGRMLFPSGGLL